MGCLMHVLAADSALRALRAIRNRGIGVALPAPELRCDCVRLPDEEEGADSNDDAEELTFDKDHTLAESGLNLDDTDSNAQVDLTKLGELGAFTAEKPLELAVFGSSRKFHRKKCVARTLSRSLPEHSLIRIDAGLHMVCPELIVVQMASRMSEVSLAQLIMELCGTYSPGPFEGADESDAAKPRASKLDADDWDDDIWDADGWAVDGRGDDECAFEIDPVTTIERIRWYARHVRARGAAPKLRRALELAMEGSASPSETVVALMLSLPREKGGYGFRRPSLNARLDVKPVERGNVGQEVYFLDAFWQDAFADVEYESASFHLDPFVASALVAVRAGEPVEVDGIDEWRQEFISKGDADRKRLRELQYLGIQVIPVTAFDIKNVGRMDQVARALARCHERAMGASMSAWAESLSDPDYMAARRVLLQELRG